MTTKELKNSFTKHVKPQNGAYINYYGSDRILLTSNILAVSSASNDCRLSNIEYEGETFDFHRAGCFIRSSVRNRNLTTEDHGAIGRYFDNGHHRSEANKAVVDVITNALTTHFTAEDQTHPSHLHIYDLGCGLFPLGAKDIKGDITFRGVEVNDEEIQKAHDKGLPVSDWSTVMTEEKPAGRTCIATGIYSLHFMTGSKIAKRLNHLTSNSEGFFVGNFYTSRDDVDGTRRLAFIEMLERNNFHVERIEDTGKTCNEYWVICKQEGISAAAKFAGVLQDTIGKHTHRKAHRLDKESLNITAAPS